MAITGTSGDDTLVGTANDDGIIGLAGNDNLSGLGGTDTIYGGVGNDTINGGDDTDYLNGQEGNDVINGGAGDDIINGGFGGDIVDGGAGNDTFTVHDDYPNGSELTSAEQFIGGDGYDKIIFDGNYSLQPYDITANTLTGIEEIQASWTVRLTIGQLSQLSHFSGIFRLIDSGTLDLTNGVFGGGSLDFANGADVASMAGSSVGGNLYGNGGDDQLTGSDSANGLVGGDGNDILDGQGGEDYLDGGAGDDHILGGDGADTIYDSFGADILEGGAGDDYFIADLTAGFDGNDTIAGGAGVDRLEIVYSGYGGDWLDFSDFGITGIETFDGGSARFIMSVAQVAQFDTFQTGSLRLSSAGTLTFSSTFQVGDFELSQFGNSIDLTVSGNGGRVLGGAGADSITGTSYNDKLTGAGGNDVIHARGGFDEISGGDGVDWIDGGGGDDTLIVTANEAVSAGDHFTGGSGTDTLSVEYNPYGTNPLVDLSLATIDADIEVLSGNRVSLTVAQAGTFKAISVQDLHLTDGGSVDFTGIAYTGTLYLSDEGNQIVTSNISFNFGLTVIGGAGDDTVTASALVVDHALNGGGGNDTLTGGGGNDGIDGGAGADVMAGGAGNDYYVVDVDGDKVIEGAGAGNDSVQASVSYVLGANVENLSLWGDASINGTGNSLNNNIYGNSGNNVLNGAAGADYLSGGDGDDVYIVDNTGDAVDEIGRTGVDTVRSSVSFTLDSIFVENLTLTGTAAINGTGNSWANTLLGNSGANVLDGSYGADVMKGGAGNDIYVVDDAGDAVVEADPAEGTDLVKSSISFTLGANLENLLLSGEELITGTGNELANQISGNGNANVLKGLEGNDVLDGGLGDDTLDGGAGLDLASYASASSGVTVNLSIAAAQDTLGAGKDILIAIEGVAGSGYADKLTGDAQANRLLGGEANDSLDGGAGVDALDGGEGGDRYVIAASSDHGLAEIKDSGVAGIDEVQFGATTADTLILFEEDVGIERVTAVGTAALNLDIGALTNGALLTGNAANNVLEASGFADVLVGEAGDDELHGAGGDDFLNGGAGKDAVDGGDGSDVYVIAAAADHPSAEIADTGASGTDEVRFSATGTAQTLVLRAGDTGIERIVIGTGLEAVAHTTGTLAHGVDARLLGNGVSVLGNSGANRVHGTGFGDQLDGGAGSDRLLGYAGDDVLDGGKQLDQLLGGLGDDTYIVDDYGDATVELVGEGTDTVIASATVTLRDNVENLEQSGLLGINGTGNALDNVMEGNGATNRLFGLEGSDTLIGNEGNDQLNGGAGNDVLIGGAGNDYYFVDSAADTVTELAGEGRDTVRATASYTLSAEVEWLELQGSANLDGTGNGLANVLKGNAGDNALSGLAGNDKLYGGAGNDSVDGGEGNDVLEGSSGRDEFTGGAGVDRFLFRDGDFGGATIATADVIHDFVHAQGDKIRLDAVDANSTLAGNQAFAFLGTGAFTNTAGQLRYEQSGGNTFVQGDLDGDGIADFVIQVDGTVNLVGGDFILTKLRRGSVRFARPAPMLRRGTASSAAARWGRCS